MSFPLYEAALASSARSPRDRFVLSLLAHRANEAGHCWPSVERIANDTGLSERCVQAAIRSLVKAGHLSIIEPGGGRHGHTNRYHLYPRPCPERAARRQSRGGPTKREEAGSATGAADAPVSTEGRNHDTPRVQPLHPTGASAAPHGGTGCTQTIREEKQKEKTNHQQAGGVVVSLFPDFQKKKEGDRAGPVPKGTILAFCQAEGIPGEAGRACFAEWEKNGWSLDGRPIYDWRGVIRDRWKRGVFRSALDLPFRPPEEPARWKEPDFDWRANFRDRYDMDAPPEWGELSTDVRNELCDTARKKKERADLPASPEELLAWAEKQFPDCISNGLKWDEWPKDHRRLIAERYRQWQREQQLGPGNGEAAPTGDAVQEADGRTPATPEDVRSIFARMRQELALSSKAPSATADSSA